MIHCCKCGVEILANHRNMCGRCLSNETNHSKSIKETMSIETCRGCQRYLIPPNGWKEFQWGSQDLLIYLLSRNKSLKPFEIVDSNFIYSEEHSKRMTVEVVILDNGVEQCCRLTYVIRNMQCPDCTRVESKQYWKAIVQLRQKPHHKRTFLFLEQLILKHKAHLTTSNIKERKDGIDFYYLDRHDAIKMVSFLSSYYGTETVSSSRLISEDDSNNTANKKFSFSVEMLPFCKDDLVYIGKNNIIGLGEFVLVTKVHSNVIFLDPITLKSNKISSKEYFANRDRYEIVMRSPNLIKYKVVYIKRIDGSFTEVTMTSDGINFVETTTHLKVKEDDLVVAYNFVDSHLTREINVNGGYLIVRIFNINERRFEIQSEKEIDDEFLYFIDDIAEDKEMVSSVCVFEKKDGMVQSMEGFNI